MKEIYRSSADGTSSDEIIVTDWERYIEFEIDNPWWGSTEQGFGATLHINLTIEQVSALSKALARALVGREGADRAGIKNSPGNLTVGGNDGEGA